MTDHRPTARVMRQRDRHGQNRREAEAVLAHRREGISGACAALGAGEIDDWDQDMPQDMPVEPLKGVQDARNGVGGYGAAQKGRKAAGARKNGGAHA